LFTRSHTDWYWYYVLPVVLGGLGAGIAWHELRRWRVPRRAWRISTSWGAVLASAMLVAVFVGVTVRARWGRGMERNPETARILNFIHEHDLHARGLLLSDWPGYVAFASDNYVVAADMLTFSRHLYERLKHSPNALQSLLVYCRRQGRPLEYVFYTGKSRWLVPTEDLRSAVLNDPRRLPALVPIGRVEFPRPPAEVIREGNHTSFAVWRLPVGGWSRHG